MEPMTDLIGRLVETGDYVAVYKSGSDEAAVGWVDSIKEYTSSWGEVDRKVVIKLDPEQLSGWERGYRKSLLTKPMATYPHRTVLIHKGGEMK